MSSHPQRVTVSDMKNWVNKVIVGTGFQVSNLGDSWQNGQAFAALIHSFRPELLDYPSMEFTKEKSLENIKAAFDAAVKAGIDPLLDAEDLISCPEQKSIFTSLTGYYKAFNTSTPRTFTPTPSPRPTSTPARTISQPVTTKETPAPATPATPLKLNTRVLPTIPPLNTEDNSDKVKSLESEIEKLKEQLKQNEVEVEKKLRVQLEKKIRDELQSKIKSEFEQSSKQQSDKLKSDLQQFQKEKQDFETNKKTQLEEIKKSPLRNRQTKERNRNPFKIRLQ